LSYAIVILNYVIISKIFNNLFKEIWREMMLIQMSMIVIICLSVIFGAETFNLKDGSSVTGERVSEDETSIKIKTVYGEIEIKKQDLVIKDYKVELKTGDTLIGIKIEENDSFIILKTKAFGEIKVIKNDILSIQELNINESVYPASSNEEEYVPPKKYTGGLLGIVTSGSAVLTNEKDLDFTEGEEQLIDIFLEPSAHTLKRSTLYMSGFSFGFGLTDNMQVTTRWIDYFHGDINFRMKYKLFSKGNWKKQSALALGVDYHQRWKASIVDQFKYVSGSYNHNNQDYYYGSWIPITSEVTGFDCYPEYDSDNGCNEPEMKLKEDNYDFMFEFFGAYTFSKARANLKGQINQTIGARALISRTGVDNAWEFYPAVYYAADFDLTPKFKILFQAIYDNHMVETYQLESYSSDIFGSEGSIETSTVPVVKEESIPVHFDFGFVYALNKNFRFAIHFQRPFIGFYWKL